MGRSIRNKAKSGGGGGGSAVSDAQLATKADAATVSTLETTVNSKSTVQIDGVASGTTNQLTALTIDGTAYTVSSTDIASKKELSKLSDVTGAASPSIGQTLVYGSGQWGLGHKTVQVVSSQPTADDEADGTLKYDTSTNKLYLRVGGAWVAFTKDAS